MKSTYVVICSSSFTQTLAKWSSFDLASPFISMQNASDPKFVFFCSYLLRQYDWTEGCGIRIPLSRRNLSLHFLFGWSCLSLYPSEHLSFVNNDSSKSMWWLPFGNSDADAIETISYEYYHDTKTLTIILPKNN